jgi:hypothetical protein
LGYRQGDAAPTALLEWVVRPAPVVEDQPGVTKEKAKAEKPAKPAKPAKSEKKK